MKATIKFYEKGYASAEVPEIKVLREELEVASKEELVELAKEVELPPATEYAHIYVDGEDDEDGEPVIGITDDGIRDFEENEWIVEPEDE